MNKYKSFTSILIFMKKFHRHQIDTLISLILINIHFFSCKLKFFLVNDAQVSLNT